MCERVSIVKNERASHMENENARKKRAPDV